MEKGFLGGYILNPGTVGCHRTQVALQLLCSTDGERQRFGEAGNDEDACQGKADVLLRELLEGF